MALVPQPQFQQPGIVIQMLEASQTCRELMGVMLEENEALHRNQTTTTQMRLDLKKRLALRLETLLADIKSQKDSVRGNRSAENVAVRLAEEIDMFRKLASQNETMLRAAHRIRADIVAMIRDTIEASQPRVTTYNANGYVQHGSAGTTVVGAVV